MKSLIFRQNSANDINERGHENLLAHISWDKRAGYSERVTCDWVEKLNKNNIAKGYTVHGLHRVLGDGDTDKGLAPRPYILEAERFLSWTVEEYEGASGHI